MQIEFAPRATMRLEALAHYIYQRSHSKAITREYLKKLKGYDISKLLDELLYSNHTLP